MDCGYLGVFGAVECAKPCFRVRKTGSKAKNQALVGPWSLGCARCVHVCWCKGCREHGSQGVGQVKSGKKAAHLRVNPLQSQPIHRSSFPMQRGEKGNADLLPVVVESDDVGVLEALEHLRLLPKALPLLLAQLRLLQMA